MGGCEKIIGLGLPHIISRRTEGNWFKRAWSVLKM